MTIYSDGSTTYAGLQASVLDHLHHSTIANVTELIALAEMEFNRDSGLRLRGMEKDTSLTQTLNSRYVALPSDYASPIALWLETVIPRQKLIARTLEDMDYRALQAYPTYWGIDGSNIAFDRLANAANPLTFRYRQTFALSNITTTNYLLKNYPDLYLFGALIKGSRYLRDDVNVAQLKMDYAVLLQQVKDNEQLSIGWEELMVDAGLRRPRPFRIQEG